MVKVWPLPEAVIVSCTQPALSALCSARVISADGVEAVAAAAEAGDARPTTAISADTHGTASARHVLARRLRRPSDSLRPT
jgi:hypothetical protein